MSNWTKVVQVVPTHYNLTGYKRMRFLVEAYGVWEGVKLFFAGERVLVAGHVTLSVWLKTDPPGQPVSMDFTHFSIEED